MKINIISIKGEQVTITLEEKDYEFIRWRAGHHLYRGFTCDPETAVKLALAEIARKQGTWIMFLAEEQPEETTQLIKELAGKLCW